jgi:hypothetical protein
LNEERHTAPTAAAPGVAMNMELLGHSPVP